MFDPSHIRMTGPLKPHVDLVWSGLLAQGYTPLSGRNLLCLMARMSRWLEDRVLPAHHFTSARVDEFLDERRQAGYTVYVTRRGLEPILEHLQTAGVVPLPKQVQPPATERDRLLTDYGRYLLQERGLVPSTVRKYQYVARSFLGWFEQDAVEVGDLGASDVASFVVCQSRRSSIGWAKYTITALRSFLRFLCLRGDVTTDLVGAVPGVAGWRQASLPKALPPQQVQQLFDSCERQTHDNGRDFAILLLLGRLGLRAGEVAALGLDDFDWALGEVIVRGKRLREDRLPLPCDVGEAIVAYLRGGRPQQATCRRLFLSIRAPVRGLSGSAVGQIVRQACKRAGLPTSGSHRLRHSAATEMLRHGASLPEIAQVLRHHSVDTTAIYAKVDRGALRELAQPWPGGVS